MQDFYIGILVASVMWGTVLIIAGVLFAKTLKITREESRNALSRMDKLANRILDNDQEKINQIMQKFDTWFFPDAGEKSEDKIKEEEYEPVPIDILGEKLTHELINGGGG